MRFVQAKDFSADNPYTGKYCYGNAWFYMNLDILE
jgi:hypothetical protein